ncbi:MAG: hypothetical protein O7A67_00175 [SAR324 cluster bacterium]|nr:hypothetical protein [SAR324 cluster bacterium]
MRAMLLPITIFVGTLTVAAWADSDEAGRRSAAALTAAEIAAFANHLALRPETAIDFSKVSGEYCFNLGLAEGGHMTHYAIDPAKSQEDVIDFVDARPLIAAGANFDGLPKMPGKLGSMTPNQWYFLPAGQFEPHHGTKLPFPLLVRASSL